MAGTTQKQLKILQDDQQARLRHPILQVRAVLHSWNSGAVATQVLEPGKVAGMNFMSESDRDREAEFVLRNVGTAEAINVEVRPQVSPETRVCIDYSGFGGSMPPYPSASSPCVPSGNIAVRILPRPKDRPEVSVQGQFSPDFDLMFDVGIRIHLDIPKGVSLYTLVFMVSADGVPSTGYAVQCHNPFP
jgi:hypothetical protein